MPVPADAAIQVVLSVGFFNGRIACVAGIVSLSCEEVRLTLGGGLRSCDTMGHGYIYQ
jgi:hypothetical protein